ncbi:MAG TPA: hypothetical protein VND21_04985, partial [Planctomycetota bacterium]|nr:hypothetical protein [Planctomycetota bacterium]
AAPGPAAAFTFEAAIVVEGESRPRGTATFAARPAAGTADPHWEITETAEIPGPVPEGVPEDEPDATLRRQRTEVVLGRDLAFRRYERRVSQGERLVESTSLLWGEGSNLKVVHVDGHGGEKSASVAADRAATATLSGLVLFLRQCPPEPASYEIPIFVHEADAVRTVRVEVTRSSGPREGLPAEARLTASVAMGAWTISIHVAEKDRALRRIEQQNGATRVVYAVKEPSPIEPLDVSKPAGSAREVGVRLVVGLLTGDDALLAGTFHWPSVLASEKTTSGFTGDEAALRTDVLAKLKGALGSATRAEAERRARDAAGAATETEDGGQVKVRFGEPFSRLAYHARQIDGAWYVVGLIRER